MNARTQIDNLMPLIDENNRGQLLVIDDEDEICKSLFRQFRRNYDVHIAASADEGYRIMSETPIQVIISDQRMPGMKGTEFFNKVKGEFPDAVRLLLTGYADIQAVIEAINDGNIFRYVTKPWDPVELETVVREAFERYNLIVQNRRLLTELTEANALLEQRVAERTAELAEKNATLEELITQKNGFMGMAAHDLRSPLTALRGFSDLLLDPRTKPEEYQEFVYFIRETIDQMLSLLNDLLDITAIEAGKLQLNLEHVDIRHFLNSIAKLNRYVGEKKQIALEVDIAPDLPIVTFDPKRIEQVLNNLLSNAFKFSHANTTVKITVERSGSAVQFAVADEGQGIPADEVSVIFGAFQKISTRPTGDEPSTGLGLSICKRIMELHHGKIWVDSEVNAGSTFYFTLPISTDDLMHDDEDEAIL